MTDRDRRGSRRRIVVVALLLAARRRRRAARRLRKTTTAGAGATDTQSSAARLSLVEQSPWVGPNGSFDLRLRVDGAPPGAQLALAGLPRRDEPDRVRGRASTARTSVRRCGPYRRSCPSTCCHARQTTRFSSRSRSVRRTPRHSASASTVKACFPCWSACSTPTTTSSTGSSRTSCGCRQPKLQPDPWRSRWSCPSRRLRVPARRPGSATRGRRRPPRCRRSCPGTQSECAPGAGCRPRDRRGRLQHGRSGDDAGLIAVACADRSTGAQRHVRAIGPRLVGRLARSDRRRGGHAPGDHRQRRTGSAPRHPTRPSARPSSTAPTPPKPSPA